MLNSLENEVASDFNSHLIIFVFLTLYRSTKSLYTVRLKYSLNILILFCLSASIIISGKPPNSRYSYKKLRSKDFSFELSLEISSLSFFNFRNSLKEKGNRVYAMVLPLSEVAISLLKSFELEPLKKI